MKKVLSITLAVILIFSMTTLVPVFAAQEVVSTVSLAGTSDNADDYVNIILTEKSSSAIKYINQIKPDSDGKWKLNFKVKGTLSDYRILFRQNGTTTNKIAPEVISSVTPGMSLKLSASIAAKTVIATLSVDNGNYHELSCDVIIASYDTQGNLIDTYTPTVDITSDMASLTEEIECELPENASYAKVFCWNDVTPLTKSVLVQNAGDYIQNRGSLGNVFTKLNNGEDVTIVYLGGSVTWGSGASKKDETSWRALTTQWFKDQYPDATITAKNSALGSTGSFWGAIRVEKDVLRYNPDLVFVMYPINDVYESMTEDETKRQMEEIIRKIREYDNQIDIIMGYDTDKTRGASRELYDMVKWQEQVAMEYNVSSMDMGRCLANKVLDGLTTWEEALSDSVHPNDYGYQIYASVAMGLLEEGKMNAPETLATYTVPAERKFGKPMNAVLYKAEEEFATDATPVDRPNGNENYSKQYVLQPGQSLSLTITGNRFGVYGVGDFKFSADGKSAMHITYDIGHICRYWWYNIGEGEHDIVVTNNSTEETATVYGVFAWDN